jgi:MarR family transcriptional regulator, organic hydroperoxide resistance regulator
MGHGSRKKTKRNSDSGVREDLRVKRLAVLGQFRIVIKSIRHHYLLVKRRSDMSGADLWALAHIAENPGSRVGDVARALAIHPSTASNLIRRLAARAMISSKREGQDRRAVQLYAARRGHTALKRAPKPSIGLLQQALADLPPRNIQALHSRLEELIAVMKMKDLRARAVPISEM